jgi:hypothetical protein
MKMIIPHPSRSLTAVSTTCSLLLLSALAFFATSAFGQTNQVVGASALPPTSPMSLRPQVDATVTVTLSATQSVSVNSTAGVSDKIALQPNQSVDVIVKFAAPKTGHNVNVDALDGGRVVIAGNSTSVAASNSVHFNLQVAGEPGICRVVLRDGAQEIGFQFWVLDPNNPNSNPPTVN